ncbi:unnamed protein product [Ambrosiozyma monospora]|uniref:Unnamed protein product n=1 Tax=Ambrosiozyma monospora TaxID=43982 RepID=A0ACB5T9I6_AMBMO|nr:unnamed protein product [Ambrosiozyma monospora]
MDQNVNKINDHVSEKLLDDAFSVDDDDEEQYYSGCSGGYLKSDHSANGSKPNSALSYASADQWRHLKSTGLTSISSSIVLPLPKCDDNSKVLVYDGDDECVSTASRDDNQKVDEQIDDRYQDTVDNSEQKQVMQNIDFFQRGGSHLANSGHYSKPFSRVAIKPQGEPLLPDSSKLMLQNLSRNMVGNAAPFFEALEYNPHCPTNEAILLSILEDEMALLDIDEDKEKLKTSQANNESVNKKVNYFQDSKYSKLSSFYTWLDRFVYRLLHFGYMNAEEYLETYPWERYFGMAEYFAMKDHIENDVELKDNLINMDMLPVGYQCNPGVSSHGKCSDSTATKKSYDYVVRG